MASVLITGTSTGIGLATALTLGRAGPEVYATMRHPSRTPELGESAKQEEPVKISVLDVDSDSYCNRSQVGRSNGIITS